MHFIQFRIMKTPILTPHKAKLNFLIFAIQFWVPNIPAAVTGSPTGVEFKLFEICHQAPLQIHW